ncbi:DNA replication regulator SLD3-domain-containing protein [Echria macrotheca]|uniref:DNA replication regulator SLD3-domain-containing protein n=1 Tax=Echria macrotheca TaxID=438768 RepID=A0AAJ0BIH5_9PEZI|nr:DNA replication regulator SLD3-domain-containing protein [Echria macrotheca]
MSFSTRPTTSGTSRPSSAASTSAFGGILTSARPSSLNRAITAPLSPGSKKRKREDANGVSLPTDELLKPSIVLKPHPPSLTTKPYILHPVMLLPRESIPLSFLDLSQPHGEFPSSRFYESRIKILDLEGRLGSNVLLARSESTRTTYAIEREGNGLYVLCRLGNWVDLEKLGQSATVVCTQRIRTSRPATVESSNSTLPLITPLMHKESKKRRLAIEEIQSKVRRRSIIEKESQSRPATPATIASANVTPTSQLPDLIAAPVAVDSQTATTEVLPVGESLTPPTREDIFQSIRAQYCEALYHSMGSLAYFAKGPLSRARAAFHLDCDSNLEMGDLIEFLRSLVMTTVLIDKKYRESVPAIIGKVSTHIDESDNDTAKPKKRKLKKPKLGRDGLYPGENEHIRRWWIANKPAAVGDDDKTVTATETKYHISCLRRRETQLQMIIILEILALEPLRQALEAGGDSHLPGQESQMGSREQSQEPGVKKKNKTNLPFLLDVHVDRLCIWQTTMSDETKALAESQVLPNGEHTQRTERANSDPLRDFCVDIITPFFSARLPDLCNSINQKLGGPVIQPPPPKEKSMRSAVPLKSRPGAPMKRSSMSKLEEQDKSLERVLSRERLRRSVSRGPSGALALLRSASATTIPGLKREGSEPLLGMIPREKTSSLKEKSANVFSRGTSSANAEEAKAKKKAMLDAELKDAISALKKPNRALAVKDLVEAAEKRASTGTSQLRKMKKPGRASIVQVKATPANNRFKDVLATGTGLGTSIFDEVPSSSSVIPASTLPQKFKNMMNRSSVVASTPPTIQATPIKQPGVPTISAQAQSSGNILSSPIMARKGAPTRNHLSVPPPRFVLGDIPSSPGMAGLFATPVNPKSNRMAVIDDTPIRARLPTSDAPTKSDESTDKDKDENAGTSTKPVSIYERLGWDTGDFDDIA